MESEQGVLNNRPGNRALQSIDWGLKYLYSNAMTSIVTTKCKQNRRKNAKY